MLTSQTLSLKKNVTHRPTVDRGIDRYIGVDTPYKTQDPICLELIWFWLKSSASTYVCCVQ